jgi:hypothetical protein
VAAAALRDEWPTVYFARAMDDQDPADIRSLARFVDSKLAERRMRLVDPYTGHEACSAPVSIVEADLRLLKGCSAVLMDMTIANRNYVGCVGELIYAFIWNIPVVVYVGTSGNESRHWLRYHAASIVKDQDEALTVLEALLRPGERDGGPDALPAPAPGEPGRRHGGS